MLQVIVKDRIIQHRYKHLFQGRIPLYGIVIIDLAQRFVQDTAYFSRVGRTVTTANVPAVRKAALVCKACYSKLPDYHTHLTLYDVDGLIHIVNTQVLAA